MREEWEKQIYFDQIILLNVGLSEYFVGGCHIGRILTEVCYSLIKSLVSIIYGFLYSALIAKKMREIVSESAHFDILLRRDHL